MKQNLHLAYHAYKYNSPNKLTDEIFRIHVAHKKPPDVYGGSIVKAYFISISFVKDSDRGPHFWDEHFHTLP